MPMLASRFAVCDQPKATTSTGSGIRSPSCSHILLRAGDENEAVTGQGHQLFNQEAPHPGP